ncbi:MAG: PaaI family thioesterase [Rhodospirillaceae bacterium]
MISAADIPSKISVPDLQALIDRDLPLCGLFGITTVSLGDGVAVLRMDAGPVALRPGGTVSGPAMMALADVAMYGAVLSRIGLVPLAVTTDLTTHFLRKPEPGPLWARARILKGGKRLTVLAVDVLSKDAGSEADQPGQSDQALVAHMSGTYSTPPVAASP